MVLLCPFWWQSFSQWLHGGVGGEVRVAEDTIFIVWYDDIFIISIINVIIIFIFYGVFLFCVCVKASISNNCIEKEQIFSQNEWMNEWEFGTWRCVNAKQIFNFWLNYYVDNCTLNYTSGYRSYI